MPTGNRRELASLFFYWFVGREVTTPHHLIRVLKTNLDILLHNTNHRWAYVIVSAPILEGVAPQGKNAEQTLAMVKEFIGSLAPRNYEVRSRRCRGSWSIAPNQSSD